MASPSIEGDSMNEEEKLLQNELHMSRKRRLDTSLDNVCGERQDQDHLWCLTREDCPSSDKKLKIELLDNDGLNESDTEGKETESDEISCCVQESSRLAMLEIEVRFLKSEKDHQQAEIKRLEADRLKMCQQLNHLQEENLKERQCNRTLKQQLSKVKAKLLEMELECMNEQIKFSEHLIKTPSRALQDKENESRCDTSKLELLQKSLNICRTTQLQLKKKTLEFRSLMHDSLVDVSDQVQAAICQTDNLNKSLVTKYRREIQLRKRFHNQLVELRGNIRVFCRVRPCIKEDGVTNMNSCVTFDPDDDRLVRVANRGRMQEFEFDEVFGMEANQAQVFDKMSALIRSVIDGFNVCIFAYGQTGSGKTHTMEGPSSDPGINQRALKLLYDETQSSGWDYQITASILEIYNETIRDLLNPNPSDKLDVKLKPEGGLHVPGLSQVPVQSLQEVNQIFLLGKQNRFTASTNMNEHSSRSHYLLCIKVTGTNLLTGSRTFGRLNLVDLAGSERLSKSQADGARLKEAQNINRSLSCLGDVIHALKNKQAHIPYRNSKLTYLLQESLGGDSKTLMVLQASPVEKNINETICTLTFGQRVQSAELGQATRRIEEGTKSTPSGSSKASKDDTPKHSTPTRTPIISKGANLPSKFSSRLK